MTKGGECRKLLGASAGRRRRRRGRVGSGFLGNLIPPLKLIGLGKHKKGGMYAGKRRGGMYAGRRRKHKKHMMMP